jgi:hypothetical protein
MTVSLAEVVTARDEPKAPSAGYNLSRSMRYLDFIISQLAEKVKPQKLDDKNPDTGASLRGLAGNNCAKIAVPGSEERCKCLSWKQVSR